MRIELLTTNDIPEILEHWKKELKYLGIPYKRTINDLIDNKHFFCIKNNNKIIGFCGYKIMKRNPSVRVVKLWVDKQYRRQGLASSFIDKIKEETKHLNLNIYAECMDGAENNLFYDKIGELVRIEQRKTMNVRFYKIGK